MFFVHIKASKFIKGDVGVYGCCLGQWWSSYKRRRQWWFYGAVEFYGAAALNKDLEKRRVEVVDRQTKGEKEAVAW